MVMNCKHCKYCQYCQYNDDGFCDKLGHLVNEDDGCDFDDEEEDNNND